MIDPRSRIIDTAFRLFLENGYKSVSIKDIMNETGFSKGGLYHHFRGKEDIFFATLERYYFNLLNTGKFEDTQLSFRDRIKVRYAYAASIFSMVEKIGKEEIKFPIRTFFMFQLESEKHPEFIGRIRETVASYRGEIKMIVEKAIENREIKEGLSSEIVMQQIISMIEGTAIHHSTLEEKAESFLMNQYDTIFESYFDLICTD